MRSAYDGGDDLGVGAVPGAIAAADLAGDDGDDRGANGVFGAPVDRVDRRVPEKSEHRGGFGVEVRGETLGVFERRRWLDAATEAGEQSAADRCRTVIGQACCTINRRAAAPTRTGALPQPSVAPETEWKPYQRAPRVDTLLATHAEYLRRRAAEVGYSAQVLLRELRGRQYPSSYETVKRFVRPLRETHLHAAVTRTPFETPPGLQNQMVPQMAYVDARAVVKEPIR